MTKEKNIKPKEIISYAAKVAAFMSVVGMIFGRIGDVSGLLRKEV